MPAIMETLALPAPPPGGLKDATPSTLESKKVEEKAEKVKAPVVATQTRSIGMIHPPPDIRSIVDKTATFVARNGPEFEKRILATNKNNVKFNFLIPTDPYHAYYRHKVGEFRAQTNAPAQATSIVAFPGAPKEKPAPTGEVADVQDDRKAIQDVLRGASSKQLEPPEPEQYTVRLPDLLTGLDLDVIKLTAQFVARNGKSFLTGLTSREHMNPQFHFLKPTHSMFTFFTALADAYSKVLMPAKGLADKLRRDAADRMAVLERCLARLEWEKSQQRARQKAEDEIEAERTQMALIDWHDFVVVETIDFLDEEEPALPQPMSLEEVIRRSKELAEDEELTEEDQAAVAQAGAAADAAAQVEKEVEMDMDEEEMQLVEEGMKAATLAEGKSEGNAEASAPSGQDAVDMDQDMEEEEEEAPMRIVRGWKRPEERPSHEVDPTKFVVSPITGELIPVAEMAEHMRISLIDPKYKEQKERMLAKLRENTLAGDEEISRNIVGLAKTRPDIFGTTEEEISNAVTAEIEKKKEEPKHVVWDGHTGSIGRTATQALHQGLSLEEQIAQIHRDKAAQAAADGRVLPGPSALPPPKLAAPPSRPLPPPPGLVLNIPRPMTATAGPAPAPSLAPPPLSRPTMNLIPAVSRLPSMPPPPPPAMMRPPVGMPVTRSLPVPSMPPNLLLSGRPQFGIPPIPSSFAGLPPPRLPSLQPSTPMSLLPLPVPLPSLSVMPPVPPPEDSAPPPPPEEPEPKRQRTEEVVLIPEAEFLAKHPGPVTILISVPLVEGEASLKGQTVEITVPSLGETLAALKEKVASEVGLPANKQKLVGRAGFFKDNLTLAYYNVAPRDTVTLGLRERGGRKK